MALFWNRLGSGRLGVGRLTETATRQALQESLRRHDVHITEAGGLLEAAAAVAPLFQRHSDATATDREIDAARVAAREELNRLGYIWCPPGQPPPITWCAGIPSLMTHVRHHVSGDAGAS